MICKTFHLLLSATVSLRPNLESLMKTSDKLTSGRTPTTATTSVRSDPEYCWINNNRRLSTDIGKLVVDFILIEEKPLSWDWQQ